MIEFLVYESLDAMRENYKRIRRAIYQAPKVPPAEAVPELAAPALPPPVINGRSCPWIWPQAAVIDGPTPDWPSSPLTALLAEVAAAHKLTVAAIVGPRRYKPLVLARHEYFYRAVAETSFSLMVIGRRCGGKDHTTTLNGVHRHSKRNGLPLPRAMKPWDRIGEAS